MPKNSSQQTFTTGFTLGLFAGVAGYYLFGTDQGKKLRSKLAKEWVVAYDHLRQEGVLEAGKDLLDMRMCTLCAPSREAGKKACSIVLPSI